MDRNRVKVWENVKLLAAMTMAQRVSRRQRTADMLMAVTAPYAAIMRAYSGTEAPAPPEFSEAYYEARDRYAATGDPDALAAMLALVACECGHPDALGIRHDRRRCELQWW